MRYFLGLSCEEYEHYDNISFCHNDLFLLQETLRCFCDYSNENIISEMVCLDTEENGNRYWYNMLEKICKKSTQNDTILFYFAGHGTILGDDAFLLLPNSLLGDEINTALSLSEINTILKNAKANSFKIIDACHSGMDVRGDIKAGFISKIMDKSWATLASCSEKEYSYPDTQKEQGIFTYFISEAIKKWEKETQITIEELKIAVANMMDKWCQDTGLMQHPTLNASIVGIQSIAIRNGKMAEYEILRRVQNDETQTGNFSKELLLFSDRPSEIPYKLLKQILSSINITYYDTKYTALDFFERQYIDGRGVSSFIYKKILSMQYSYALKNMVW